MLVTATRTGVRGPTPHTWVLHDVWCMTVKPDDGMRSPSHALPAHSRRHCQHIHTHLADNDDPSCRLPAADTADALGLYRDRRTGAALGSLANEYEFGWSIVPQLPSAVRRSRSPHFGRRQCTQPNQHVLHTGKAVLTSGGWVEVCRQQLRLQKLSSKVPLLQTTAGFAGQESS